MVVDDLSVVSIAFAELENEPPWPVDDHRPLATAIAAELVQTNGLEGRNLIQRANRIEKLQSRHSFRTVKARKPADSIFRKALGGPVLPCLDHEGLA
jgi:hypothetical protein